MADGPRFIMQEVFQKALVGDLNREDLEPRTSPAFLAGKLAKGLGTNIVVKSVAETGIHLNLELPNS